MIKAFEEQQQDLSLAAESVITGTSGNDNLYGTKDDDVVTGLEGDDTLYTMKGDDVLDGGTGNDYLMGGDGSDTYLFGLGYGQDAIYDTAGQDRVVLGTGITTDDIMLSRTRDGSLNLFIKGTSDHLDIQYQFGSYYGPTIKTIEFADGTVWGKQDFLDRLVTSEAGDLFYGGDGNETIDGLGGDDWLYGGGGDDVIDGGNGDDSLAGQAGNDTYLFGVGSGADEIADMEVAGDFDQVLLGAGITADDVSVARANYKGPDLLLTIKGTGDQLTIENYFTHADKSVDIIKFADGTTWDHQQMLELAMIATEDDDYLVGTDGDDVMDALGGDDEVFGKGGNDQLSGSADSDELNGGAGNDILKGGNGFDHLWGDAGDDLLIGGDYSDDLHGGKGDDNLKGGTDNDELFSGSGNDTLSGGSGRDEFHFSGVLNATTNVDTITDFSSADDTLNLDAYTFAKINPNGWLNANLFVASETGDAVDADDRILYETDTGNLYYDADGNGAHAKKLFAILGQDSHPELTASDFYVG